MIEAKIRKFVGDHLMLAFLFIVAIVCYEAWVLVLCSEWAGRSFWHWFAVAILFGVGKWGTRFVRDMIKSWKESA